MVAIGVAVELGEGHDGDVEFLGDGLDGFADLGDFEGAGLAGGVAGAVHELEVVHDDEADLVGGLGAAGAGAELRDGEAGGLVDEEGAFHQSSGDVGDIGEGALVEESIAKPLEIHPGLGANGADHKLAPGHFDREDERGHGEFLDGMKGKLHPKRAFAAGGPGGDDDHLAAHEASGAAVEIMDASGKADGFASIVINGLDVLDGGDDGIAAGGDGVLAGGVVAEAVEDLLTTLLRVVGGECVVVCRLGHG